MNRKAFTLLELLVALIVIGLLVTLAVPQYIKTVDCRYQREARDTLDELLKADQIYRQEHAVFTDVMGELPLHTPNHADNPVVYALEVSGSTKSCFRATATHTRKPDASDLCFDATTRFRGLNEAGWPCPRVVEGCVCTDSGIIK